jgi:hypothetical protein
MAGRRSEGARSPVTTINGDDQDFVLVLKNYFIVSYCDQGYPLDLVHRGFAHPAPAWEPVTLPCSQDHATQHSQLEERRRVLVAYLAAFPRQQMSAGSLRSQRRHIVCCTVDAPGGIPVMPEHTLCGINAAAEPQKGRQADPARATCTSCKAAWRQAVTQAGPGRPEPSGPSTASGP